jgi:IMP dehydrogenase/GMP reductase
MQAPLIQPRAGHLQTKVGLLPQNVGLLPQRVWLLPQRVEAVKHEVGPTRTEAEIDEPGVGLPQIEARHDVFDAVRVKLKAE